MDVFHDFLASFKASADFGIFARVSVKMFLGSIKLRYFLLCLVVVILYHFSSPSQTIQQIDVPPKLNAPIDPGIQLELINFHNQIAERLNFNHDSPKFVQQPPELTSSSLSTHTEATQQSLGAERIIKHESITKPLIMRSSQTRQSHIDPVSESLEHRSILVDRVSIPSSESIKVSTNQRLRSFQRKPSLIPQLLYNSSAAPMPRDLIVFTHIPKTGGGSFYNTLRWLTAKGNKRPRWYPDLDGGSASFSDVGCGLKAGSAHCDVWEIDACITHRYNKNLPASATTLTSGQRLYITVLRDPSKRVISEFSFACVTKKRTRRPDKFINTPDGPKALLDWSHDLWRALDYRSCADPTPEQFTQWLLHPDNPAHARYARFFIPRQLSQGERADPKSMGVSLLYRFHNCLAGDPTSSLLHWKQVLSGSTSQELDSLSDITTLMNSDSKLVGAAISTLLDKFWFVGILEELQASYRVFCQLGHFAACGTSPPTNEAIEHSSKKKKNLVVTSEMSEIIQQRNGLDQMLYDIAASNLISKGAVRRSKIIS